MIAYVAPLKASIGCPSCGYVMYENNDGSIQCGMNDCELYHKRFEAPTTLLLPVDDE